MLTDLKHRVRRLTEVPPARQGRHPDPQDPQTPPPDRSTWPTWQQEALDSPEMALFRNALAPGADPRQTVLAELAEYHGTDEVTALNRSLGWEEWSVKEWQAADRSGPDGLAAFYESVESWSYDLLWYAYLQTQGYGVPESVVALRAVGGRATGRRHLDFGSGVGVTSQLFAAAGYETDLADVSPTLLAFARWRLERRNLSAGYIDLTQTNLEADRYDVVTAIDTLTHVPDVGATARDLHRVMRPGAWLVTNFDVRTPAPESAWHLYQEDAPLRASLHAAGFAPAGRHGNLLLYRRRSATAVRANVRRVVDRATLDNRLRAGLGLARRRAAAVARQTRHR